MRKIQPATIEYNRAFTAHRYTARFVENPRLGLRFVDYADKIVGLNHTGWYTDDDGIFAHYRGVVYQLPARDGKPLYVSGYESSEEKDAAVLCFTDAYDSKELAARRADNMADRFAEAEREYQRAWQAGQRFAELGEDVKEARQEALKLCQEMRALKPVATAAPTICDTLRAKVKGLYRQIQKLRKERKDLLSDYGREDAFREGAANA